MNGGVTIPDKDTARALNDLARHKAIVRILNDIRMDMEICEIEGWDKNEYLNLIRQLINSIGGKTMNDSISRQAAIDAVDAIGHIATMPDGDKCIRRSAVKYTLSMLPPAQPEQRWIPVSERLPELDEDGYSQKVLACYGNYSGCDILEYRATEGIGKWYIGDMDESPEDIGIMVLAWMPLPEKYKGEQYG